MKAIENKKEKPEILSLVTRGDIILVAALLVLSAVLFVYGLVGSRQPAGAAEVSVCGEQYAVLPLEKDTTLTVTGQSGIVCVVEVADGRVRMTEAHCPDRLCVGQGWIDRTGEVIVCLPARVTVTLQGEKNDFDAVSV
ncbi:MAG: NusG domain II-containing protein [Ruminococcaceae bacterium]|nr:NusG domain II-containing protein [Oscillospiraceae bacterium]